MSLFKIKLKLSDELRFIIKDGRYRFSAFVKIKDGILTFPEPFGDFRSTPQEPFDMGPCIQLECGAHEHIIKAHQLLMKKEEEG